MSTENIWANLDFSVSKRKSAYDYLVEQSSGLVEATNGILKTEIEALDVITDDSLPKPAALYILYIVCPYLGNYRRKILSVLDNSVLHFPVDIFSHIDEKKIPDVEENDFLKTIENILSTVSVKMVIQELFNQSKTLVPKE